MALDILQTEESDLNEARDLYLTYLHREPLPSDEMAVADQLQRGLTNEQAAAIFATSFEYYNDSQLGNI